MADRTVTVRLQAEISRFKSAMAEAGASAKQAADGASKDWDKTAARQAEAWDRVGNVVTIAGAAIATGVGVAVKKYADFDAAMSNVRAATHASAADMEQLRAAAIKAGADTAFSGEEAARGIEELAKAGISTKDILNGGLNGALALAAAGQLDVGDAAEIAATAMTQFGLSGDKVGHVADLLAAGAGKAQGSVGDLGYALKQSGLVASQAGLSIEETTGTLAAFASAGLIGSDAGTSFKSMLQRLQNPSKEAAGTMKELGISMYDSQGNFVGMANLAEQLKTSMEGLTPAQRDAAMATIFGSDAVRAASVLYQQGGQGIQEWIGKVNDAGYAAETAAMKQDNLAGDLEKLGGAIDNVVLQSGSGLNDFLRGLVQFAESAVDAFGKIPAPVLAAGATLTGLGTAAVLLGVGLVKTIGFARDFGTAMSSIGLGLGDIKEKFSRSAKSADDLNISLEKGTMSSNKYSGALRKSGIAVASFALAFNGSLHKDVTNVFKDGADAAGQFGNSATESVNKISASFASAEWANRNGGMWNGLFDGAVTGINNVGDAVTYLNSTGGLRDFTESVNDMAHNTTNLAKAKEDIASLDAGMAQLASGGNLEQARQMFKQFADQTIAAGGTIEDMTGSFPQLISAVQQYGESLGVSLSAQEATDYLMGKMPPKLAEAAAAQENMSSSMADMGAAAEEAHASLKDVYEALTMLGMAYMSQEQATGAYYEALTKMSEVTQQVIEAQGGLGEIFDFNTGKFNQTTEAGRMVSEQFFAISDAGFEMAEAMANNGASQADLQAALQQTYNDLISAAAQFGITGEQADTLARSVLGIPADVDIESWMSDSAKSMAEATDKAVNAIPDSKNTTLTASPDSKNMANDTTAAVGNIQNSKFTLLTASQGSRDMANSTSTAVNNIPRSKHSTLTASSDARDMANQTANAINSIPYRKDVTITVNKVHKESSLGKAAGLATGGMPADISSFRGFARGGGLIPGVPPVNPLEDNKAAIIQDTGEPIMVRSREFIVNEQATRDNLALLRYINAGGKLTGFASGGSPSYKLQRGFYTENPINQPTPKAQAGESTPQIGQVVVNTPTAPDPHHYGVRAAESLARTLGRMDL